MDNDNAHDELDRIDMLRAASGDRGAFAALYLSHASRVYGLCLRIARDSHHAEDLTQETFLRALRAAQSFRQGAPFGPWLRRIAANLAIDWQRSRLPQAQLDMPEEGPAIAAIGDDPLASVQSHQLLSRLPLQSRTIVWLVLVEGWTHAELAVRFGRSESWSKSILSRALSKLESGEES